MKDGAAIKLEPKNVNFTSTFINAESQFVIKIKNPGKKQVHCSWRQYPNEKEEKKASKSHILSDSEDRNEMIKECAFHSKDFTFQETEFTVWPKTFKQILVFFHPVRSIKVNETAYLLIEETGERIPCTLSGVGQPPEAVFSVSSIKVGHVALDTILEYEVSFENIGSVVCEYNLIPRKTGDLIFEFFPNHGFLNVGQSIPIRIKFYAMKVCSFNETFEFSISGKENNYPSINLYGKIYGPTIELSTNYLMFNTVSYGFLYEKSFDIINKSQIDFDFSIDTSSNFSRKEFSIQPERSTVKKNSVFTVKVEFIPMNIGKYNLELYLNIANYKNHIATIPIIAECFPPVVQIPKKVVDMGDIFIGMKYKGKMSFLNEADTPAKFEFFPLNDIDLMNAQVDILSHTGVVKPKETADVYFTIVAKQLGVIEINQFVKFYGCQEEPSSVLIKALSRGPKLQFSENQLNYGRINVLTETKKELTIINNSAIPAAFTAAVDPVGEVFSIDTTKGVIEPNEQITIGVFACLDDIIEFSGKITFYFDNLNPIIVNLTAQGTGSTITSSIPLTVLNFGNIYSKSQNTKTFELTNEGRRKQELRFSIQRPTLSRKDLTNFTCKIIPDSAILEPGDKEEFRVIVSCNKTLSFSNGIQCSSNLQRQRLDLFTLNVKGTIISPSISFSDQTVAFKHVHDSNKEEMETGNVSLSTPIAPSQDLFRLIEKQITIKNEAKLPITCFCNCPSPFSILDQTFILKSQEERQLHLTFDPTNKKDFSCEVIKKNLVISYEEHPQVDRIALEGSYVFPNINFSPKENIDFGVLTMNTERSSDIKMENPTELPVDYVWEIITEDSSITNIFDLYPIRGHIEPNSTDVARVSFFAHNETGKNVYVFKATALCHVIGGPDYVINLSGEAANIQYKISTHSVDFGNISYIENANSVVTLQNLSDVQIDFSLRKSKNSAFKYLSVTPTTGTIQIGGIQKFVINAKGGFPREIEEPFFIKIGYFDEERIDIKAVCCMPQAKFSIPHDKECPLFLHYIAEKKKEIEIRRRKKMESSARRKTQSEAEEEDISEEIIEPTENEFNKIEKKMLIAKLRQDTAYDSPMKKKRSKKAKEEQKYDGYVSSKFVIDVGRIIFGKKEKFNFDITSLSPSAVSFNILDYDLKETGFYFTKTTFENVEKDEKCNIELNFDVTKKTKNIVGENNFEVPIKFNQDFAYLVKIHCNLVMPTIRLSQNKFNFGTTIVGQAYIMTLQLQNMNYVPIEYRFNDKEQKNMFTISSTSGLLPPSSFQNVEISFLPTVEGEFKNKIPIYVRHNTRPVYIELTGVGVQLNIKFDPPRLSLPPICPFSEPSTMEVTMINPTDFPIEVTATQFDLQLLIEDIKKKKAEEQREKRKLKHKDEGDEMGLTSLTEVPPQVESPNSFNVTKFSLCVIVHGPHLSGKTTLCKKLAKELGNVPIISLKEIWANLINNPDADQSEYVNAVVSVIERPEYADGFVVDGLEGLPDNSDTESFITKCIKTKTIWDELQKNPLEVYQHPSLTSYEQALSYVLASLNGHYVFLIALGCNETSINEREENLVLLEKKQKMQQAKAEKERILNMTDEEYMNLTLEEKEDVDRKRSAYRKRNIKQIIETEIVLEKQQEQKKERSSKSKSKPSHDKSKSSHEKSKSRDKSKLSHEKSKPTNDKSKEKSHKEVKPLKEEKIVEKKVEEKKEIIEPRKSLRELKTAPNNETQRSMCLFSFTLGSIVQKVREESDQFAAIDPNDIIMDHLNETNATEPNSATSSQKVVLPYQKDFNTILIDASNSPEVIADYAVSFVPKIDQMKEKAFTKLIPFPRIVMPDPSSFKKDTLLTMPEFFSIIVDDPETPETVSSRQRNARPDSNTKSGRKSKIDKERPDKNLFSPDDDLSKRTPRWKLDPNSSQVLTIKFDATNVGNYTDNIIFSIVNGKSQIIKLPVRGTVAYPDITRDDKFIFPKKQLKATHKTENCFITSTREFYFGSVLVEEKVTKGADFKYKSTINIKNPSLFPVELTALFADTTQKQVWNVETPNMSIQPGETQSLTFGVRPTTTDFFRNELQLFIRDNPEPYTFSITADCCAPNVEFGKNTLDFEKILLDQVKEILLPIKNVGKIPASWCIKNAATLGPNFKFSKMNGILNPMSSTNISVKFTSSKPIAVKKPISVEIMDKDSTFLFNTQQIRIISEAFDANAELSYPKGLNHLDYGVMKVQKEKTIPLTLKNKGKYPIEYRIHFTNKKYEKLFNISPMEETLSSSNKTANINVTFTSSKLVSFAKTNCFSIDIIDTITNEKTQTIPVCFSAKTVYSKFKISSEGNIDFGSLATGNNLTKTITIENNGSFPFEYEIVAKVNESELENTKNKGKNKKQSAAKNPAVRTLNAKSPILKNRTKKAEKYIIDGNFVVIPSQAIVQPNTKVDIDIDFVSQVEGQFNSTLFVNVSDVDPTKNSEPISINMQAEALVPSIENNDFEKIFVGTQLCLRYDIVKNPRIAFLEDDQVLFFSAHMIGERTELPMTLKNPLPIPCTVECNMKPNAKGKAAIANFPFDVSEKILDLPPKGSKTITIFFQPNSADLFVGTFEATVHGSTTKSLKFGLEGIGALPSVTVLNQLEKTGKGNIHQLNVGRTLIGFSKTKIVSIANQGVIDAKVIISAKPSPDFNLFGANLDTEITLHRNDQVNLSIDYVPQKVRKGQFNISFSIVDNPKANFSIAVLGEGFAEDLIFEGLQDDDLYFRGSVVGRPQNQTFAMRNISGDVIRFQWPQHEDFAFTPSVGHIKSGMRKEITVTFHPTKIARYANLKVLCQWQKIRLNDPNAPDWDNSQKTVRFTTKGALKKVNEGIIRPSFNSIKKPMIRRPLSSVSNANEDDKETVKIVDVKPEPSCTVIPVKTKDLILKVTALSDYIKYSIDTTEISFSPTMMFEKRIVTCRITNTSQIRFDYGWRIRECKSLRTNYCETRMPPFSITPSTGFIDAGQTTVFNIAFEPEEVDNFIATLQCDIPYLMQMKPPFIKVSGLSKRPLCHFNVVLSDYISAGRRHPDYTDQLPDDIRVIEMFSSGIGHETRKKFEIINPTSMSYEINWRLISEGKSPISCETPVALVSSGKRYSVSFTYTPTSVKTIESHWIFQIPEYRINVMFLFVGRIVLH